MAPFRHQKLRHLACIMSVALGAVSGCGERAPSGDRLTQGKAIYATHCAACHGAKLEGQPNWRQRLPSGRLPAPPHDETGHTWHHPDELLFNIVKNGIGPYAPPGYQSDMPAFANALSDDDIRAALDFIRSTWPSETRKLQSQMNAPPKR